jgi:4'-phosphopantetheinyl transferase
MPIVRCDVWWAAPAADPDAALAQLGDADQARGRGLRRPADRARFATGRLLARRAVAAVLGVEADAVHVVTRCPRCGSDKHGRAELASPRARLHLSIAHAGDRVVVAVCEQEVGVDVERIGEIGDLAGAEAGVLAPQERRALGRVAPAERPRAFFVLWTRKEAVLKATGQGLGVPPAELQVSAPSDAPAVVAWPPSETARPAQLRDLDGGEDYTACVAVLTGDEVEVAEHSA